MHKQQQHSSRGHVHFQKRSCSSAHNKRRAIARSLSSPAASASIDRPTLFSLPGLAHPSDFAQLAQKAIRDCDSIRRELASALNEEDDGVKSNQVKKAKQTLHLLDDISNVVCTVIDAAELCRSTHASQQWRNGASDAFGILSEYIGSLNTDERLYRSLRRFVFNDEDKDNITAHGSSEIMAQLSPEYQRMATAMRKEFER